MVPRAGNMSSIIIRTADQTKRRLCEVLNEIKRLNLDSVDQMTTTDETIRLHQERRRITQEKIMHIQIYIEALESVNTEWKQFIQQISVSTKRKEEEDRYLQINDDESGITNLILQAKQTVVILKMYQNDSEFILQRLNQSMVREETTQPKEPTQAGKYPTVNLPQLPLPTFSGNPRRWREFWNSFDTAIHQQAIPDIHKLNYLITCLKGDALQAIRGYDITPENYSIVRNVLVEKFGQPYAIKRALFTELYSIRKNDREWKATLEAIERTLRQLEAIGENLEQSGIEIAVEGKLPTWILEQVYRRKRQESWSVTKLRNFLTELASVNEEVVQSQSLWFKGNMENQSPIKGKPRPRHNPNETSALTTSVPEKPIIKALSRPCALCNKNHWDEECQIYPTLKQRLQRLKKLNACLNCFKIGHMAARCKNKKRNCFHCKGQHNSALCPNKFKEMPNKPEDPDSTTTTNIIVEKEKKRDKRILLLCKQINVFNPTNPNTQQRALALFDVGSQLSFVSKNLAKQLMLNETDEGKLNIASFGKKDPNTHLTTRIEIGIKIGKDRTVLLEANTVDYLTNKLQVVNLSESDIRSLKGSPTIDFHSEWKQPDILIGANHFFQFINFDKAENLQSGFTLLHTKVGPILAGSGYTKKISPNSRMSSQIVYAANTINVPDLDQFWKLELIGIQDKPEINDDEEALKQFKQTIRKSDGRYQVAWPWKDTSSKLSDNFELCLGRLQSLIKRLHRNQHLLTTYNETINEQLRSNVIERVSHFTNHQGIIHYLPHHEVVKSDNTTTKVRIVYDASAHLRGRKSLNDVLYRGPITLPDLAGILIRLRTMKIIIIADVEKAFLQLELLPTERDCTRFLWVKDIQKQVDRDNLICYLFKRVPFGVISSPFLLSATLNYHLEHYETETAREIKKNLYVDNIILSASHEKEALNKYEETKSIFKDASMNVREFLSNNQTFNEQLPKSDRARMSQIKKILGIKWNPHKDHIQITLNPWTEQTTTKRTILRFIASQYDPLGFLVPLIVPFKIFLQELWRKNIHWDQPLDNQLIEIWNNLVVECPTHIKEIPRFTIDLSQQITFHVFTDASTVAYAAVVYAHQNTHTSLLFAKS